MAGLFQAPLFLLILALYINSELVYLTGTFIYDDELLEKSALGFRVYRTFCRLSRISREAILNSPNSKYGYLCSLLFYFVVTLALTQDPIGNNHVACVLNQSNLINAECIALLDTPISSLEASNSFGMLSNLTSPIKQSTPMNRLATTSHTVKRPQHHQNLRIYNINFQSIRNKHSKLQAFLENENPDVIMGTDTWLNSHIPTTPKG